MSVVMNAVTVQYFTVDEDEGYKRGVLFPLKKIRKNKGENLELGNQDLA